MNRVNINMWFLMALVIVSASLKLLTHPHSIDPIIALSLFSGVIIKDKKMSFAIPLLTMFFSDILLEIFYPGNGFYGTAQIGNYFSLLLITVIGFGMKKNNFITVPLFSIAASLTFYFLSNTNVFLVDTGAYYSKDWNGYFNCMTAGIPFIKNSLLNDLLFSVILFGGYEFIYKKQAATAKA